MSRIRGTNTSPELKVRRWLHGHGFRFRVNVRRLPGSPDIVLARYRTCIFVNGCFWHGHDGCPSYTHPKTNPEFWEAKVSRNKMRDQVVEARLEAMHWKVLTIWECELKNNVLGQTMESLASALRTNRKEWLSEREQRKAARELARAEKAARNARQEALADAMDIPARIREMAAADEGIIDNITIFA